MKPPNLVRRALAGLRDVVSVPILFLAGVVVLASALAYEAQDAARSSVRRAEATLRDYSAYAATEYARQLRTQVFTLLRVSLSNVPAALNFRDPPVDPSAVQVRRLVLAQREWVEGGGIECASCYDGMRYFFRVGVADSTADFAPADSSPDAGGGLPSPEVRRWVRDTVLAKIPFLADTGGLVIRTLGTVDDEGRPSGFGYFISNDSYVLLVGEPDGVSRMLGFVVSRDDDGTPLAAYGYEADPELVLRPLLLRALRQERLLPPSLLKGLDNEEALAVAVSDGVGRPLLRPSSGFDGRFASFDTLPGHQGSLRVTAAVFPDIAEEMLGGESTMRLPVLLLLVVLTIGMAVVALLQIRRQQELARLRTDFVSSVSHELRTPLAQIRWFAELLRMGRLRSEEERDRSLRIIDQEARRLAFLVENVLNFSRAGQSAGRVSPEPSDVSHEVREVVEGFRPLASARRVKVETRMEPGTMGMVDHGALRQIVLNLLDNAAKYGPAGQTVLVGVSRTPEGNARIWVDDEGPGVPESERERVWSPFVRAERDLVSAVTGSGIGLSVVADLVELQKGRRWIERGRTGGARVVIELPAPPDDADESDDADYAPPARRAGAPERPTPSAPAAPAAPSAPAAPAAPGASPPDVPDR